MLKRVALPAALTLSIALVAGCQSAAKKAPIDPPPTDAAYQQIKAEFATTAPNAKVGYVSEVNATAPWLAVSMVNPAEFPVGSIVSIVDANKSVVAHGDVQQIAGEYVYVKFEAAGARGPKAGDVAVKF